MTKDQLQALLAEREAEIERLRGLVAAAVETPTGGGEAVNAEALQTDLPGLAPLSPREQVLGGLEELFGYHGIENPAEAVRVAVLQTVDLIIHSGGRLPDNTTRALMTLR